jgi:ATP-dependent helicase HrpA
LQVGNLRLPVRYNFSPGELDDGVTVSVPLAALNQMTSDQTDWLVPGLLEEKVTALIRSLPKPLRRNFVPVPDTARTVISQLNFGEGALLPTLAALLSRMAGERIESRDFQPEKLPDHLRMNIQVLDDAGEVREMGRELTTLRAAARPAESSVAKEDAAGDDQGWNRDGITSWDFGPLPAEVTVVRGGIPIAAYPALIDRHDAVELRLLDSSGLAELRTHRGIARLYLLAQRKSIGTQIRWLPHWAQIEVWAASAVRADELKAQLSLRIAELAFLGREGLPRDDAAFASRLANASERIAVAAQELAPLLPRLFEAYHLTRVALEGLDGPRFADARTDLNRQLRALVGDEFLVDVPWKWLEQYPRYLAAMVHRIDKLKAGGQARDAEGRQAVEPFWERYVNRQQHNERLERADPALTEYRWMIEEYRVSLFAQPLGTSIKISPQRLEKQWALVRKD